MRCRVSRILLMRLLPLAAACSEDQPHNAVSGASAAPETGSPADTVAKTISAADIADRWLKRADNSDYIALKLMLNDEQARLELQSGVGRLLELCRTDQTQNERVKAALLLSLLDDRNPVAGMAECVYDLMISLDFQDKSFWDLKAMSKEHWTGFGFQDLFKKIASPGNEAAALDIVRHVAEMPQSEGVERDNSYPRGVKPPLKSRILSLMAPGLRTNKELFQQSYSLIINGGFFKHEDDFRDYNNQYLWSLPNADEAVAFYNFCASELIPEVKKNDLLSPKMRMLVRGGDENRYEIDRFNILDFELNAEDLPRLDPADSKPEKGKRADAHDKPDAKYIVVTSYAPPTEVSSEAEAVTAPINKKVKTWRLSNLTTVVPTPWRAASFSEADRIIYIESTFKYSYSYEPRHLAYNRIDNIGVYDRVSGQLIKHLQTRTIEPINNSIIFVNVPKGEEERIHYHEPRASREIEEALAILGYFHLLPWEKGYRKDLNQKLDAVRLVSK